ncbi:hypothetical protein Trichorick_00434 [Candidatus Trichorickettsia mobilis]|uniref:Uncharacterized protein n=1 Tax=Candidatus Trichorickettsia mobilis TaxID=1346319 RepID=A0ABZ0UWV5_9RICK|nr:hypothetical protein [Candidatus Trichorickettsia mobilis]WPY00554.1 hypothetical protein Trichorick_00434 [Candidatus Trichorickettsia mobilis]
MNKNKVTWEEILQKFDQFEHLLDTNIHDSKLNDFFVNIREDFSNGTFQQCHIIEAKNRVTNIIQKIAERKQDLQQQSNNLIKQRSQFDSYIKVSHINKKN